MPIVKNIVSKEYDEQCKQLLMEFVQFLHSIGYHLHSIGYYADAERETLVDRFIAVRKRAVAGVRGVTVSEIPEVVVKHAWVGNHYEHDGCCSCGWICNVETRPENILVGCKEQWEVHVNLVMLRKTVESTGCDWCDKGYQPIQSSINEEVMVHVGMRTGTDRVVCKRKTVKVENVTLKVSDGIIFNKDSLHPAAETPLVIFDEAAAMADSQLNKLMRESMSSNVGGTIGLDQGDGSTKRCCTVCNDVIPFNSKTGYCPKCWDIHSVFAKETNDNPDSIAALAGYFEKYYGPTIAHQIEGGKRTTKGKISFERFLNLFNEHVRRTTIENMSNLGSLSYWYNDICKIIGQKG